MNDILKVAAAAVMTAVCAIVVRKQAPEIGLLLALCGGVLLLLYISGALSDVVLFARKLAEASGLESNILEPIIKTTGISIVTRLAVDLCKDAKEGALAGAVEIAGSVLAVFAALPLMTAVLDLLTGLL